MYKFKPEAFFIDLDGTLMNVSKEEMSIANEKAIFDTIKSTPVVISTGRVANNSIKRLINKFNIPYAICQNGAVIVDQNMNIIRNIYINKESVSNILQVAMDMNLLYLINSHGNFYTNKKYKAWIFTTFSTWEAEYYKADKSDYSKINKILMIGSTRRKIRKFKAYIETHYKDLVATTTGKKFALEITHSLANKGTGNEFVADLLKVDKSKTIHIGDNMNDSKVIGHVGALVALKNADEKLKELADYWADHYKKDGVAKALNGQVEVKK